MDTMKGQYYALCAICLLTTFLPIYAGSDGGNLHAKSTGGEGCALVLGRVQEYESGLARCIASLDSCSQNRTKTQLLQNLADLRNRIKGLQNELSGSTITGIGGRSLSNSLDAFAVHVPRTSFGVVMKSYPGKDATSMRCYTDSDFSQSCYYKNACIDGKNVFVLSDSVHSGQPMKHDTLHFDQRTHQLSYAEFGAFQLDRMEFGIPFKAKFEARMVPTSLVHGQADVELAVSWTDEPLYTFAVDSNEPNTFHWAYKSLMLWDVMSHNHTLRYPSLGKLFHTRTSKMMEWESGVLKSIVQDEDLIVPQAKASQIVKGRGQSILCSREMVVTGNKARLFNGVYDAASFRTVLYRDYDVELEAFQQIPSVVPSYPVPRAHLVILQRDRFHRSIANLKDLQARLDEYDGLSYEVFIPSRSMSFQEQVEKAANTGILLGVHGAGLTNMMFMRQGSVVIEVFTYGMKKKMYTNEAMNVGVHYVPIVAKAKGNNTYVYDPNDSLHPPPLHSPPFDKHCSDIPFSKFMYNQHCYHVSKAANTVFPLDDVEAAILDGFDMLGARFDRRRSYGSSH